MEKYAMLMASFHFIFKHTHFGFQKSDIEGSQPLELKYFAQ